MNSPSQLRPFERRAALAVQASRWTDSANHSASIISISGHLHAKQGEQFDRVTGRIKRSAGRASSASVASHFEFASSAVGAHSNSTKGSTAPSQIHMHSRALNSKSGKTEDPNTKPHQRSKALVKPETHETTQSPNHKSILTKSPKNVKAHEIPKP